MSDQLEVFSAVCVWTFGVIFFAAGVGLEAIRAGTFGALVDFGVGVPEVDCDVSDLFVLEFDSMDAGDGFDYSGFTMCDMSNCADVDGGLSADDVRREDVQSGDLVEGLFGELRLLFHQLFYLLLRRFVAFHCGGS